ncbi:HBS1-like protein [Penicillium herquei]|nr:HBS1-like protein [Penicillium herquei]
MSKNRVKNVGYEDDDFYDDDGYDSPDPEEQEHLKRCTDEVSSQLRTGQPSVTTSKEEIQEALWHYYNDVEKTVNYLRGNEKDFLSSLHDLLSQVALSSKNYSLTAAKYIGKKEKEAQKQQATASVLKTKAQGLPVPVYPATASRPTAHFSAAEFFRDCPWLNVPAHRKAEILVEPLYPRLGLLGGAPEVKKGSKLAALAAARKAKASGQTTPASESSASQPESADKPKLSLQERLAASSRSPKPAEGLTGLRRLGKPSPAVSSTPSPAPSESPAPARAEETTIKQVDLGPPPKADLRAPCSVFATALIGKETRPKITEPNHGRPMVVDFDEIYGHNTEHFDFSGPSPDDVILKAQSASQGIKSKPKAGAAKDASKKGQTDLAGGMNKLSVEEKVTVKSKNLDVLAEYKNSKRKRSANFVVIGHVDAGKSTLMGRLLADQGAIDQRTLDRYRKEAEKIGKGSFALAWVLDQGSEERARGVTIDIATNKFETENTAFTIVDAPGHRDFVPNMIAGASQADFAVLVIDSSVGKFESGLKGQTKEHALLVRSMGVQKIVVAVNKMDTVKWDKDRFEEIEQQISAFLTTAGFQSKNISFVPCSGVLGDNISRRSEDAHASWYSGRTLIEELETSEPYTHALDKPLRMTIGDVFRGGVQSPISISGRLDAGSLQVGDQILTMPSGESALIRSIEVDGEPNDWAVAGQNVVLNLANIDPIHLRSGDVVCRSSSPIPTITTFTAKVLAFEHLMPMLVDVHRGRLHVPARISKLVASLDKASGATIKKRPKIVSPGTVVRVVVEMDTAVPLEAPTRVVLRTGGSTVAAGLLE